MIHAYKQNTHTHAQRHDYRQAHSQIGLTEKQQTYIDGDSHNVRKHALKNTHADEQINIPATSTSKELGSIKEEHDGQQEEIIKLALNKPENIDNTITSRSTSKAWTYIIKGLDKDKIKFLTLILGSVAALYFSGCCFVTVYLLHRPLLLSAIALNHNVRGRTSIVTKLLLILIRRFQTSIVLKFELIRRFVRAQTVFEVLSRVRNVAKSRER